MCYENDPACTPDMRAAADVTDDGVVDQYDYNLWLGMWWGFD